MPQELIQTAREEQQQQLRAMQVAMSQLVEMPLMDLCERVRDEMEENEALEPAGGDEADSSDAYGEEKAATEEDGADTEYADDYTPEPATQSDAEADYLSPDDVPDYLLRQDNGAEEREVQIAGSGNSYDDLYRQIGEHELSEREEEILRYLIGSLDDDGYLHKDLPTLVDEMCIYQNLDTTEGETERLLHLLQTFEPRGIGARNLRECLRLQLEDPDLRSESKALARQIVDRAFHEFTKHDVEALARRFKVTEAEAADALALLLRLNPKPGSALNDTAGVAAPTVVPDFYVEADQDGIRVRLNHGDMPELRISRAYRDTVREYSGRGASLTGPQKDAYVYARKKVADAQMFIELIRRRQHTLLSVMRAIADVQRDFFLGDDDEQLLVPMKLQDVADRAGVDISTVSRVKTSKYVETRYGTYPLEYFFSTQFTAGNGTELSQRHAMAALRDVVSEEDKRHQLSDQAIAERMKEKGFPISRRTVAKYRDLMGIPKSGLRK